jgi:hypothetical protein
MTTVLCCYRRAVRLICGPVIAYSAVLVMPDMHDPMRSCLAQSGFLSDFRDLSLVQNITAPLN